MSELCLLVEVPICAFRPYASREYQDTYPVPTPASVYGMLLSLLGIRRENKPAHRGVEMALAVESIPERSKVFRKLRRGDLEDLRPDYQDILMDLRLWVWLRRGADTATPPLTERLRDAFATKFTQIQRAGGVSLSESSYLIDSVSSKIPPERLVFVMPDPKGYYSLPVWVDHVENKTKLERFRIDDEAQRVDEQLGNAWFRVPVADPLPVARPKPKPKKKS